MSDVIHLRAHHLLCTMAYEGKGYDANFTKKMNEVTRRLREEQEVEICLENGPDDLCSACPNLSEGVCRYQEKVMRFDDGVKAHLNLLPGKTYRYWKLTERIHTELTQQDICDICGDCEWYEESRCSRLLLSSQATPYQHL